MNLKLVMLCLAILSVQFISAVCDAGQIDINSASATELDNLIHVGSTVAEYIIETRPFESLDDLTQVEWIGVRTSYIEDIKKQGLACVAVDEEETQTSSEDNKEVLDNSQDYSENENKYVKEDVEDKLIELNEKIEEKYSKEDTELETIELNPITSQIIKSDNDSEVLSEGNYAKYGLVLFCFFLLGLFATKKYKVRKNEFR